VLVTHRLANVRHADQILVLERGRLIESRPPHGASAGEPDTVPA
jgi:ABC-type multidrug transport system fused ATPase/permease subunit